MKDYSDIYRAIDFGPFQKDGIGFIVRFPGSSMTKKLGSIIRPTMIIYHLMTHLQLKLFENE